MTLLEVLGAHAAFTGCLDRELPAFCTTFSPVPIAFVGPLEGLRGRLWGGLPAGEELVGGQSRTYAARLWLLPHGENRLRLHHFQVLQGGEWVWLVRQAETLPHHFWSGLNKEPL